MSEGLFVLCATAASIGFLHTILGPDHYLPFVAMSRVGGWSLAKTVVITVLCGIGHVLSSVVLGLVGIAFGVAVLRLETIEGLRGDLAGWLLLAFGLVYFVWGVRRAIRNEPHVHRHVHANGTMHSHEHGHVGEHVHVHEQSDVSRQEQGWPTSSEVGDSNSSSFASPTNEATCRPPKAQSLTPWVLFTIFLFGPCEPLIPILMYPAAKGNMWGVALVTAIFGTVTIATMTAVVVLSCTAIGSIRFARLQRYGHALAGFVVFLCGAAIKAGL